MDIQEHEPKRCHSCGIESPVYDARDVDITRRGLTAVVPNVNGWFCSNCGEMEFDVSLDAFERWAAAGDALVLQARKMAEDHPDH